MGKAAQPSDPVHPWLFVGQESMLGNWVGPSAVSLARDGWEGHVDHARKTGGHVEWEQDVKSIQANGPSQGLREPCL